MLAAWATERPIGQGLEMMFPSYVIMPGTFGLAALVTVVIGVLAGVIPALRARRLPCIAALRGTD
jgi:ABC-type antimicrobial peptide transport system permease subunit